MTEKSRYQQFMDIKCRNNKVMEEFSKINKKKIIQIFMLCAIISSLAFLSASNQRLQYEREQILLQNQIKSTNVDLKFSDEAKLHDNLPQYNCDEIKQLLAEHNYKKLEELYPDENHKFLLTTVANETVTLSRRKSIHFNKSLLVEIVPDFYNQCLSVGRRSHIINTCLGAQKSPHFIDFDFESVGVIKAGNTSGKAMAGFATKDHSNMCFPVYSLLLTMGNPKVNLFVLDIEGYELAILRTIPWDKVDIEVISVETDLAGKVQKDSSPELITKFLEDQGYTKFRHRNDYHAGTGLDQNSLFVRNDVVKARNVKQLGNFPL